MKRLFSFFSSLTGFIFGLVLLIVVLTSVFTAIGFGHFTYQVITQDRNQPDNSDGIVVLTGGKDRISAGAELLRGKKAAKLLISGINQQVSKAQIASIGGFSTELSDCCITFDFEAKDTVENAAQTSKWVKDNDITSLILVTSDYHMPRSLFELRNVLPDVRIETFPVRHSSLTNAHWYRDLQFMKLMAREYSKYLVTALRGDYKRYKSKIVSLAASITKDG